MSKRIEKENKAQFSGRRLFLQRIFFGGSAILFGTYLSREYLKSAEPEIIDMEESRALIISIAKTIIPFNQIPGEPDIKIYEYVLYVAQHVFSNRERRKFTEGLIETEELARGQHGKSFRICSDKQKLKILEQLEASTIQHELIKKIKRKIFGDDFITMIKTLTIECYCTSEHGCKTFYQYDWIPGEYDPNLIIDDHYPAWATK